MEYDEILESRLSVLETRIAFLEQQLFVLTRGGTVTKRKPRRELTPEEKAAVRERLVAGQEKARASREAQSGAHDLAENEGSRFIGDGLDGVTIETEEPTGKKGKKGTSNGTSATKD